MYIFAFGAHVIGWDGIGWWNSHGHGVGDGVCGGVCDGVCTLQKAREGSTMKRFKCL